MDDLGVYLPPELVADLYAPDLVITPDYIGPSGQSARARAAYPQPVPEYAAPVGRHQLRPYGIVVVALVTVAVSVLLTLIVSGYADHPAAAPPPDRTAHSVTAHSAVTAHSGSATPSDGATPANPVAQPSTAPVVPEEVPGQARQQARAARKLERGQRRSADAGRRVARTAP